MKNTIISKASGMGDSGQVVYFYWRMEDERQFLSQLYRNCKGKPALWERKRTKYAETIRMRHDMAEDARADLIAFAEILDNPAELT